MKLLLILAAITTIASYSSVVQAKDGHNCVTGEDVGANVEGCMQCNDNEDSEEAAEYMEKSFDDSAYNTYKGFDDIDK